VRIDLSHFLLALVIAGQWLAILATFVGVSKQWRHASRRHLLWAGVRGLCILPGALWSVLCGWALWTSGSVDVNTQSSFWGAPGAVLGGGLLSILVAQDDMGPAPLRTLAALQFVGWGFCHLLLLVAIISM
jgi:hypothetical protein